MNKTQKKLLSLILLVFLSISFTTGCRFKKTDADSVPEDIPVETHEAALGGIKDVTKLSGIIEAQEDVKVTSKIGGRISSITKDVGDVVQKGEPIVYLETSELQNQLAQAEATLEQARASLRATESTSLPSKVEQARAALEQAEANYNNTKADFDRMKALYAEDAISKQVYDGMTLKYEVAKTQYETAKEQYRLAKQGVPQNIDILRAQVKQAQAAVDLIRTNLQNSVITSPVSGVVSAKYINTGEVTGAGTPILSVVNIDKVKTVIDVSEEDINKIKDGQEVDIKVDALDEEFKGTITIVPPASSATALFQVKIDIENSEHKLKPGMFADVEIVKGIKEDVVVVPKDAILLKKHGNVVFVVEDEKAVERHVKLGITNDENVEIIEGIKPGELVVIKGQNLLKEGAKVKL